VHEETLQRLTSKRFKELAKKDELPESKVALAVPCRSAEAKAVGEPGDRVRRFILSTGSVDREGDVIDQDGWDLESFREAGVFLWAHNNHLPPIGDPIAAEIRDVPRFGKALVIDVRFAPADMPHPMGEGFGHTIMRMYDEDLLKSTSAGFLPLEYSFADDRGFFAMNFLRQELLEGSAVPVPANRDALQIARSKGIAVESMLAYAETLRDDPETGLLVPTDDLEIFLDSAAKTSVLVTRAAAGTEGGETGGAADDPTTEPLAEGADNPAEDADCDEIERAAKAIDQHLSDAVTKIGRLVTVIERHGRALTDEQLEVLRKAHLSLADLVADPAEPAEIHAEPDPLEPKAVAGGDEVDLDALGAEFELADDDEIDITPEEIAQHVTTVVANARAQLTGELPA
jgi:hypothetical protein